MKPLSLDIRKRILACYDVRKHTREQWSEKSKGWQIERPVFIDESGAKTNMTRLRGRAMRGARARDCAPHGEVFLAYVVNVLVPTLRQGDIVVLDNLGAHKNAAVETAIRAVGATVEYLPAYSPDLNPIEKMWSKKSKPSCGHSRPGRQGL